MMRFTYQTEIPDLGPEAVFAWHVHQVKTEPSPRGRVVEKWGGGEAS